MEIGSSRLHLMFGQLIRWGDEPSIFQKEIPKIFILILSLSETKKIKKRFDFHCRLRKHTQISVSMLPQYLGFVCGCVLFCLFVSLCPKENLQLPVVVQYSLTSTDGTNRFLAKFCPIWVTHFTQQFTAMWNVDAMNLMTPIKSRIATIHRLVTIIGTVTIHNLYDGQHPKNKDDLYNEDNIPPCPGWSLTYLRMFAQESHLPSKWWLHSILRIVNYHPWEGHPLFSGYWTTILM